ncbi:MAG: hypothetical protein EOO71_12755 [Myxococcaceae bacterium]|nr:MAG: hypothetical protein EOO71_12755 [Myxococcaceae bacterium]
MDGGLAILGFGLFILSLANLMARTSYWLAWPILAIAMVAMGMAFSESKKRDTVPLGVAVAMGVLGIMALAMGTVPWLTITVFLFAGAFGLLWAEFRYDFFGLIPPGQVPHPAKRGPVHWPWQRRHIR